MHEPEVRVRACVVSASGFQRVRFDNPAFGWHFITVTVSSLTIHRPHSMPRSRCSSRSCQTVLPEHEQTTLSSDASLVNVHGKSCGRSKEKHLLSQTPALLAITPTSVSGSFLSNCSESVPSSHLHRDLPYLSVLLSRHHNASADHLPDVGRSV
jgi:hypothetical protein